MSYYSDLAFVVAFDDKEKLTAWLCASMLEIQQELEWYGDNKDSHGFEIALALIDVLKCGGYRHYEFTTPEILAHTFVVESSFNKLPWSIDQKLGKLAELAENMGGGGGHIIIGEDMDDTVVASTSRDVFDMCDYFEMQRVVRQTNEKYTYDGGKLLADVLGVQQ